MPSEKRAKTRPMTLRLDEQQFNTTQERAKKLGLTVNKYVSQVLANPEEHTKGAVLSSAINPVYISSTFLDFVIAAVTTQSKDPTAWAPHSEESLWLEKCEALLVDAWDMQGGDDDGYIYERLQSLLSEVSKATYGRIFSNVLQLDFLMDPKIDSSGVPMLKEPMNEDEA